MTFWYADRCVPIGDWELQNGVLKPTTRLLQSHNARLAMQSADDPPMTFEFLVPDKGAGESEELFQVHRSHLVHADGPLRALVSAPFEESRTGLVKLQESRGTFQSVRRFLYVLPIDLSHADTDLALVADRWELKTLFEACFVDAELRNFMTSPQVVAWYLPVMAQIDVPERFKTFFAFKLGVWLDEVEAFLAGNVCGHDVCAKDGARINCLSKWRGDSYEGETSDEGSEELEKMNIETGNPALEPNPASATAVLVQNEREIRSDGRETRPLKRLCHDPNGADALEEHHRTQHRTAWSYKGHYIWEVLQSRGMLKAVIKYTTHFARKDYTSLLLDIILHELEESLSDEESIDLLRQLDLGTAAYASALRSSGVNEWPNRAWRLLALAGIPCLGGEDIRLWWHPDMLFDSILDDNYNQMDCEREVRYDGCTVGLDLRWSPCGRRLKSPLILRVGLTEITNVPSDLQVSICVEAICNGCGCLDPAELRCITARPLLRPQSDKKLTLAALIDGIDFVVLDGKELNAWLKRHDQDICGLVFCVRLRIWREDVPDNKHMMPRPPNGVWTSDDEARWKVRTNRNPERNCSCGSC